MTAVVPGTRQRGGLARRVHQRWWTWFRRAVQPGVAFRKRAFHAILHQISSAIYEQGLYLATSAGGGIGGGGILSSADGLTWEIRSASAQPAFRALAWGNGTFVAIASNSVPTAQRAYTSPDGITWTAQDTPVGSELNWWTLKFANGLFVTTGWSGAGFRCMTSPDGFVWTLQATPGDYDWNALAYGNGIWVALDSRVGVHVDRVMTSSTGNAPWALSNCPDGLWRGLCFANGQFVAVAKGGTNGKRAMTSPDGVNWTLQDTPTPSADLAWQSVDYGDGLFVACQKNAAPDTHAVMTSPDGVNWTLLDMESSAGAQVVLWAQHQFFVFSFTANEMFISSREI